MALLIPETKPALESHSVNGQTDYVCAVVLTVREQGSPVVTFLMLTEGIGWQELFPHLKG